MLQAAEILFDCLPLRSVGRLDVPLDASDGYRARFLRLKEALSAHGTENAYFLYNAHCVFRLANSDVDGMLRFEFEGTAVADLSDAKTEKVDLEVRTAGGTCGDLPEPVEAWFHQTVRRAVAIEFDRFILEGDLANRIEQIEKMKADSDVADCFLGMHL
jgi:hypothetical protein